MDLSRVSGEEKLNVCKKYFFGGFALLPFLWLVNFIWFFKEAFIVPEYPQQNQIKKYILFSLGGLLFWTSGFIAWVSIYQVYRITWGPTGDYISFNIPVGKA